MSDIWDQSRIQQHIVQEIEESLTLDYKAADSLSKADGKKKEITKDVAAMANAAGGVIIYGVKEYQESGKQHLPEKIDPVDQTQFPKEWLEQIINNIRPKIDGLVIHPVKLDTNPNHVAYVVEIPQGTTAHQATDFRYYKRFNFQSVPMADHEVKDVMGRNQHPTIELEFQIESRTETIRSNSLFGVGDNLLASKKKPQTVNRFFLRVRARNVGRIFAQYVNAFILVPATVLHELILERKRKDLINENGHEYCEFYGDNTVRDVVDVEFNVVAPVEKYGPARYDPILPGLSLEITSMILNDNFRELKLNEEIIKWSVHADNAPQNKGEIKVERVEIIHT